MTDYAVCAACRIALTSVPCLTCGDRLSLGADVAIDEAAGLSYTGFGNRFLIATLPAAVLALFVESTLYGFVLYLGVYLTYCAWREATAPVPTAIDTYALSAAASSPQLTAHS